MIISEKVNDVTAISELWTQVSEIASWDDLDLQFSTTRKKRRELKL